MAEAADKPEKPAKKGDAPDSADKDGDAKKRLSHTAKRAQERREKKLQEVQDQIDEGSLTIRQMTPEERAMYPPRPRKQSKKR